MNQERTVNPAMADDDILSQEEIDALLDQKKNVEHQEDDRTKEILTEVERDALGEVANISMGSAATALYSLLNHKVEITTPQVKTITLEELREHYPIPCVIVEVFYTEGLEGINVLVIKKSDAAIIADLMMGGDGQDPDEELGELHISAVGEAMNQMMGSAATSMSTVFDRKVSISPPETDFINFAEDEIAFEDLENESTVIQVSFNMIIGDLIDSELIQIIPIEFAQRMVESLISTEASKEEPTEIEHDEMATEHPAPDEQSLSGSETGKQPQEPSGETVEGPESDPAASRNHSAAEQEERSEVKPAQFSPFEEGEKKGEYLPQNIDIIRDVPLEVTVELGQTKMLIRDILELGSGSIIELNKLAGEPVDILVNGKLVARGEVVVIDENFGVRVTDIISPMERIENL